MTEVRCTMNARGGIYRIRCAVPGGISRHGGGCDAHAGFKHPARCEAVGIEMVDKGCIVVLDAPTGRVRASVSLPLYDPENVAASIARRILHWSTAPQCI